MCNILRSLWIWVYSQTLDGESDVVSPMKLIGSHNTLRKISNINYLH